MTSTIWALLSIENNYDQPDNNLVCFWHSKPSFADLSKALGIEFPSSDELTLYVVRLWQGEDAQIRLGETAYRLRELEADKVLGERK